MTFSSRSLSLTGMFCVSGAVIGPSDSPLATAFCVTMANGCAIFCPPEPTATRPAVRF